MDADGIDWKRECKKMLKRCLELRAQRDKARAEAKAADAVIARLKALLAKR